MPHCRVALVFILLLTAIGPDLRRSYGGTKIDTLLVTQNQVPNEPTGVMINWISFPSINHASDIAVYMELTGPGIDVSNDEMVAIINREGEFLRVVATGDLLPQLGAGVSVGGLLNVTCCPDLGYDLLQLNQNRELLFPVELVGNSVTSNNDLVVALVDEDDGLSIVVREGDQVPGLPSGVLFGEFRDLRLNEAGDVIFFATLTGTNVDATNNFALFRRRVGQNIEIIFRAGDSVPGLVNVVFSTSASDPQLSDSGKICFQAWFDGQVSSSNNQGVFLVDETNQVTMLARKGTQVPQLPFSIEYRFFNRLRVNNNGLVTFGATLYEPLVGPSQGLFVSDGISSPSIVAMTGQAAPGLGPDTTFGHFELIGGPAIPDTPIPITNAGRIAYVASLQGDSIDATNDEAIFSDAGVGGMRLIVRVGDVLGPDGEEVVPEELFVASLNNRGALAIAAYQSFDNYGLFLNSPGNVVVPLLRTGQTLLTPTNNGTTLRVVERHWLVPDLTEQGTLAVWLRFQDNHIGVVRLEAPDFGICPCPGDLNEDGRVAGDDLQGFVACLVDMAGDCDCANVNGFDGVTPTDIADLVEALLASDNACP